MKGIDLHDYISKCKYEKHILPEKSFVFQLTKNKIEV